MRAAVLFSGGKDSTLAAHEAVQAGFGIRYLVSIIPESGESYMFHHPNIELTKMQAKLMGIPIITRATEGKKEIELRDLELALESIRKDIDCVVSGAVASKYQLRRVNSICEKLGLKSHAPLWHRDPLEMWHLCLDNGFKVTITAVACEGLGKPWLGRVINRENLKELQKLSERYRFHLGGEGGEFETFVMDCPLFKGPVKVSGSKIEWDEKTKSGFVVMEETE
jgi:diphthine-ammonia ligase